MEIKLQQIGEEFSDFRYKIFPQDLDRLDKRFEFESVECEYRLKMEGDTIRFVGQYKTVLNTTCDFCLSPVKFDLEQEFELDLIQNESYIEPEGDVEIHLNSKNTEFYQGSELNITQYFEDQILLDLPLSIGCKESCQGICTQCGANKNELSCDCDKKTINNPFAVLSELDLDLKKD